jgi:hypothetical protein
MKAKTFVTPGEKFALAVALLFGMMAVLSSSSVLADEPFKAAGTFVEGCTCSPPCPCQLVGIEKGCTGVGAMTLTSGSYMDVELAGAKIAYATGVADWVRLYVDAPNARQREAAQAFAKAVYGAFGKIEAVKDAKIEISGKDGRYTVSVDGGKIMQLTTEPILGGDKSTPIAISNIHDPLHPNILQAKTITGSFNDDNRSFTLKDSNSYFTDRMQSSGKL